MNYDGSGSKYEYHTTKNTANPGSRTLDCSVVTELKANPPIQPGPGEKNSFILFE